jgi:hypothetical protein
MVLKGILHRITISHLFSIIPIFGITIFADIEFLDYEQTVHTLSYICHVKPTNKRKYSSLSFLLFTLIVTQNTVEWCRNCPGKRLAHQQVDVDGEKVQLAASSFL